jgi:hypothetical protein
MTVPAPPSDPILRGHSGTLAQSTGFPPDPRILCVKFRLLLGVAGLAVLAGINQAVQTVEWWGGSRACGPNCVAVPSPWSQGVPAFASIVGLIALAAVLAWLAVRIHRRPA